MEETKRKWEQDGFEDDGSLACLGLNTDRESKSFSCSIAQQQALAGQTFYIVDAFADVDLKGKNMYLYKMKPTLDAPETEARKVWTGSKECMRVLKVLIDNNLLPRRVTLRAGNRAAFRFE